MSEAPVGGELIVGLTAEGDEVVILHPKLQADKDGVGHLVFSADQAENLARILMKKVRDVRGRKAQVKRGR